MFFLCRLKANWRGMPVWKRPYFCFESKKSYFCWARTGQVWIWGARTGQPREAMINWKLAHNATTIWCRTLKSSAPPLLLLTTHEYSFQPRNIFSGPESRIPKHQFSATLHKVQIVKLLIARFETFEVDWSASHHFSRHRVFFFLSGFLNEVTDVSVPDFFLLLIC